jgi:hypothetical protein
MKCSITKLVLLLSIFFMSDAGTRKDVGANIKVDRSNHQLIGNDIGRRKKRGTEDNKEKHKQSTNNN